mgnify:CR=1 FL=1
MQLKRVAEAKLPTPWGDFLMMRMLTDAAFFAARREGVRPGIVEQ